MSQSEEHIKFIIDSRRRAEKYVTSKPLENLAA